MKIVFILLLISFVSFAQTPKEQLLENDWYLIKLIYNGNEYTTPSDSEINTILLNLFEDTETENLYYLNTTGACDSGVGGMMSYVTNESFSFFDISGNYPSNCEEEDNNNFANMYLAFYIVNFESDFPYTIITNSDGSKTLTVSNQAGNQAIYSNQQMSVADVYTSNIKVYPNPVKDKIRIENPDLKITSIKVNDSSGKLIIQLSISTQQPEIDFSRLSNGIYFVSFEENGKVLKTEKVVKK